MPSFLFFRLGADELGIAQSSVREIVRYSGVTAVPGSPPWLRGVFNLRGRVVPAIDFAARLGLPSSPVGPRTCLVVLEVELGAGAPVALALAVDAVTRIDDVESSAIQPPPPLGLKVSLDHMTGVVRRESALIVLVDVVRAFATGELLAVSGAPDTPAVRPDTPVPGLFLFEDA